MFAQVSRPTEDNAIQLVLIKSMLRAQASRVTEQDILMACEERRLMQSGMDAVSALMSIASTWAVTPKSVERRLKNVDALMLLFDS